MGAVLIYRKAGTTPAVPNRATVEAATLNIRLRCRVQRPAVFAAFLPDGRKRSAFHSLPALPSSVIDSPVERLMNHRRDCLIVPVEDLGRRGEADSFTAESIRLWLKKWIAEAGLCGADEFAVVYEKNVNQAGDLDLA